MLFGLLKAGLLLELLRLFAIVSGQSPCPNYFRYVQNEGTDEITGHIQIASAPKGIALHLSVSMSVAIALPSKYVGRLELEKSREESVRDVQQGRPLQYKIHFPLKRPIPVLTGLWFNNQQVCSGPRAFGPIVTSIVLNHTLYPPGVLPLGQNPSPPWRENGTNIQTPSTLPEPVTKVVYPSREFTTPDPRGVTAANEIDCGRNNQNNVNLLIAKGTKTSPGQWPWLAAIFIVKLDYEFQCAGSLVTNTHVITAAHCFQMESTTIPTESVVVSLGRYRLRNFREKGSINRELESYRFHPSYDTSGNADADIAVLILRERVEYSVNIKPICLWSGSTNLESVVGKYGYVVGWGRDELGNVYLQEPRMARAPVVSQEVCLWSNTNFVKITSNRTFCAGLRDGSGPCNGDSGSGFVMHNPKTGRYHLRGIVSRSFLDSNTMSCDLTQYVVYVDLAQHLDWIREQVST